MSESADDHEHEAEPEEASAAEDAAAEADAGEIDAAAAQETLDQMLDAIRQAEVAQLILSTVSTLASVAYGKLEMKETREAKKAIDAVDALLPLLEGDVDEGIRRDFTQALANLKLAYADAVSSAQ